ncbi:UNVERIFIED_CONTAM: hypothetical protein NCL1_50449 [Trichonephila clavipes]
MKIRIKKYTAVATWHWVTDDVDCGICRMPLNILVVLIVALLLNMAHAYVQYAGKNGNTFCFFLFSKGLVDFMHRQKTLGYLYGFPVLLFFPYILSHPFIKKSYNSRASVNSCNTKNGSIQKRSFFRQRSKKITITWLSTDIYTSR